MTMIRPEELSAYLDGELDPGRAAEVARAIAADPRLSESFRAIGKLDDRCAAAAEAAAFLPDVPALSRRSQRSRLPQWALAGAALLALRGGVRLIDTVSLAYGLQAIALLIVLALVLRSVGDGASAMD